MNTKLKPSVFRKAAKIVLAPKVWGLNFSCLALEAAAYADVNCWRSYSFAYDQTFSMDRYEGRLRWWALPPTRARQQARCFALLLAGEMARTGDLA